MIKTINIQNKTAIESSNTLDLSNLNLFESINVLVTNSFSFENIKCKTVIPNFEKILEDIPISSRIEII